MEMHYLRHEYTRKSRHKTQERGGHGIQQLAGSFFLSGNFYEKCVELNRQDPRPRWENTTHAAAGADKLVASGNFYSNLMPVKLVEPCIVWKLYVRPLSNNLLLFCQRGTEGSRGLPSGLRESLRPSKDFAEYAGSQHQSCGDQQRLCRFFLLDKVYVGLCWSHDIKK